MKAKTKCPNCEKEVIEECEGCISGHMLIHGCKFNDGIPHISENVNWEIIE